MIDFVVTILSEAFFCWRQGARCRGIDSISRSCALFLSVYSVASQSVYTTSLSETFSVAETFVSSDPVSSCADERLAFDAATDSP